MGNNESSDSGEQESSDGTLTTSVPLQEGVLPIVAVLAIAGLRTLQKDGRAVLLLPMVDLLILILQTLELLLLAPFATIIQWVLRFR